MRVATLRASGGIWMLIRAIFLVLVAALSLTGLAVVLQSICRSLNTPQEAGQIMAVLPVVGEMPQLEYQVRSLCADLRDIRCGACAKLFLVDCGAEQQTREICRLLAQQDDGICFCDQEEYLCFARQAVSFTK